MKRQIAGLTARVDGIAETVALAGEKSRQDALDGGGVCRPSRCGCEASGDECAPSIVYETHPSAPGLLCCHPDCRTELPTGGYHAAVCNIQLVIDELWSGPGDRPALRTLPVLVRAMKAARTKAEGELVVLREAPKLRMLTSGDIIKALLDELGIVLSQKGAEWCLSALTGCGVPVEEPAPHGPCITAEELIERAGVLARQCMRVEPGICLSTPSEVGGPYCGTCTSSATLSRLAAEIRDRAAKG